MRSTSMQRQIREKKRGHTVWRHVEIGRHCGAWTARARRVPVTITDIFIQHVLQAPPTASIRTPQHLARLPPNNKKGRTTHKTIKSDKAPIFARSCRMTEKVTKLVHTTLLATSSAADGNDRSATFQTECSFTELSTRGGGSCAWGLLQGRIPTMLSGTL